jgi:hypothetical protein
LDGKLLNTFARNGSSTSFEESQLPHPVLEWCKCGRGLTLRWSGNSTGMALGPRSALVHRPLRGPSTIPAPAPQLKR